MCLAIPAKILSVDTETNCATVDYGGVTKSAQLDMVEAAEGDYVLIHAGFAIEKLSEEEAMENLEEIQKLIAIQEEMDQQ